MNQPTEKWNVLREIGKHSTEGVIILNLLNKTVVYQNDIACAITGFQNEAFPFGLDSLMNIIVEEDQRYVKSVFANLKSTSFSTEVEFRLKKANDQIIFVCCNAHLISNAESLVLFIKDITKAKQHENYLVEFGTKKNTMLEMVVHHFSGTLHLMQHLSAEAGKSAQANDLQSLPVYLNLINENSKTCVAMIETLLKEEYTKAPRVSIKNVRINVVEKVKLIYDELKLTHATRNIDFQSAAPAVYVNTDEFKLLQIINNFVSNAMKFTTKDKMILFLIEDRTDEILISISDNGIGIPLSLQPFLFDRQSIAGRTGLLGEPSSGLGLSICQRLAELMHATIGFESEEGKGSRFYIRLPKNTD